MRKPLHATKLRNSGKQSIAVVAAFASDNNPNGRTVVIPGSFRISRIRGFSILPAQHTGKIPLYN
eukprot:1358544-Amphidinium_carterae.1